MSLFIMYILCFTCALLGCKLW